MRTPRFLLLCFAIVLCLHLVSAVPHQPHRRQDEGSVRTSATSTAARDSASVHSERATSTIDPSSKPSASIGSVPNQVPVTTTAMIPESTSSAAANANNLLPIQPKVTPAMGVIGAILLITGLVYAIVGIKNKWIYVFGSAAYLTALAVTVLIIYLMSPPVSDGVQGAFFVAAFFTGLIFGVLSLVFSDITEGFGCLLGGFCLSMWFLSLKDGGLISSNTGRAIFIGCMSAGGYTLSFSHHTRNYGLIASISFSGATATMLGIDCLARAGWKEFWLYLWGLNDTIFPLNTNTYPLTKNIKAELAGVVIIAVFGVVSQLRVWKMVKAHREKSAEQELQKQQEQEREEQERGRKVEDNFQKERAQWEATYGTGNQSVTPSSTRSSIASPKGTIGVKEREVYTTDSLEMVNLDKSGRAAEGTTVTVSVLKDDIQPIDAQGNLINDQNHRLSELETNHEQFAQPSNQPLTKKASFRSAISPPPQIIPLPFTIPEEEDLKSVSEDNSSVSAVPESVHPTVDARTPMSKRFSDLSITRRFSERRARGLSTSEEALMAVQQVDDDRGSSVAATLDEENDYNSLREISPPHSPIEAIHDAAFDSWGITNTNPESIDNHKYIENLRSKTGSLKINDENSPKLEPLDQRQNDVKSLTSSTEPKMKEVGGKRSSFRDPRVRVDTLASKRNSGGEEEQPLRSTSSNVPDSQPGTLGDAVLPVRMSRAALSYRTNEWAKHLETAEKPSLDDLHVAASQDVIPEEEALAPVSDDIAYPLAGSRKLSRRAFVEPDATAAFYLNRSTSALSQNQFANQHSITPSPTAMTPAVLSRSNSNANMDAMSPLPSNTLMGQREALMKKRTSSQSITPGSSAINLLEQAEQENMSLAQRRQMLQNHQAPAGGLIHSASNSKKKLAPSTSQKWQSKGWAGNGVPSGFDSHQPKRTNSAQSEQRREELLSDWRNSIQDASPPQTHAYHVKQQRRALINEKRQKDVEKQRRETAQQQRASQIDSMMRSGQMLDAHKEMMRKMQANANRHAS